jgi:hypothetical protein
VMTSPPTQKDPGPKALGFCCFRCLSAPVLRFSQLVLQKRLPENNFDYSGGKTVESKSNLIQPASWFASDTSKPHANQNKPKSENNQTNFERVRAFRDAQNARFAAFEEAKKKEE